MTAHKVTFQGSGLQFLVEEGETILAAGLRQGFQLSHLCRQGVCGTCAARLVSGNYSQEEGLSALSKVDERNLLMCSSYPRSDIVLAVDDVYAPGEVRPQEILFSIQSVSNLCADVLRVQLVPEPGELPEPETHLADPPPRLPSFLPGQYLKLLIEGEERAYSIASAPENDAYIELHIKVVADHPDNVAIINFLKQSKQVKGLIPFGRAFLQMNSQRPAVFIAGGTGLAPHKAMIESALMSGWQQEMSLYWGVATEKQFYGLDLLSRWNRHVPHFQFHPVVFKPADSWDGKTGPVHEAAFNDIEILADHDVYLSGSMDMVKAVYPLLMSAGLPRTQLFSDMADIIDLYS